MILSRIPIQKRAIAKTTQISLRFISVGNVLRKNFYETLGLTRDATQAEIKNAYFELSKMYHPDRIAATDENLAKFREISAAYEVLGNEQSRKLYDRGILGDFKRAGAEEPDEKDPVVKFYKQRQEISKIITKPKDAWFDTYYKDAKKKTKKHELFSKTAKEVKYACSPEKIVYHIILSAIAVFLITVDYENGRANKFWKRITFQ